MYYNPNRQAIHKVKSKVYIASKTGFTQDEYFNQIPTYDKPQMYMFNIQNVSQDSEIREFGELSNSMKVAVIREKSKYLDKFKDFDAVYLDGASPKGELAYGDNANYRIYSVRNQNTSILVYFIKTVKNEG